jgi:hypothetical protein
MSTTTATRTTSVPTTSTVRRFTLLRTGAASGALAAVATTVLAVGAHGAGVSFADRTGQSIPWYAFGQLTFVCALLGVGLAAAIRRRSAQPQRTFARVAWSLAAVSCVAPTLIGLSTAGTVSLVLLHLVAAAVIVPSLTSRLPR